MEVYDDLRPMIQALLRPGDHIHVSSTASRPNALVRAVAATWQGRGSFVLSTNALHASGHALTLAGVVERAVLAFAGDSVPTSRSSVLYDDLPQGSPFPVEEWTLLTLVQRLRAAAEGQAWARTRSLVGTDLLPPLLEKGKARLTEDGHLEVRSLQPDISLVHAAALTPQGDLLVAGPQGEGAWGALAARRGVVATVETMRTCAPPASGCLRIPASTVLAVAPVPFGAHPQGLAAVPAAEVRGYLDDYEHLAEISSAVSTVETARQWFDTWVRQLSHEDYLAELGQVRLSRLQLPGEPSTRPRRRRPARRDSSQPTRRETVVLLASRAVRQLARERGYRRVLGGLGLSHLAAWHAALVGRRKGLSLSVVDEMGNWDYTPFGGDTFLFSQRHALRSQAHLSTAEVLGDLLEQPGVAGETLAVLSAAQVDASGRLNTSRAADGRFLVGSGGASDIAARVATLVVSLAAPERLPPAVDFVTSPGDHVDDVVTEHGWARRDGRDGWYLASGLALEGRPPDDASDAASTWWPQGEPRNIWKPDQDEFDALTQLDPEGVHR